MPGHAKCLEREPPFDDDRDVVGTQDLLGLGDLYGYETSFAPLADVQIPRDPQRVVLEVCRVGVREPAVQQADSGVLGDVLAVAGRAPIPGEPPANGCSDAWPVAGELITVEKCRFDLTGTLNRDGWQTFAG